MKPIICGKFLDKYFIVNRFKGSAGAIISKDVFDILKKLSSENANLPSQLVIFLNKLGFSFDTSQRMNDLMIILSKNESQSFRIVSYEITERCNFKCNHCVFGKERSDKELSIDNKMKVIKNISNAGCVYLKITGGEPLLAKGFKEVYSYAHSIGMLIKIQTNGSLLTKRENQLLFKKLPPHKIVISFYGATKKSYESLTEVQGSFAKFVKTVEWLKVNKITTKANIIVASYNEHEVEDMVKIAEKAGFEYFVYTKLTPTFQGKTIPMEYMTRDCHVLNEVDKYNQKSATRNMKEGYEQCFAGKNSFHVNSIGNVMICQSEREEIFNITKESEVDLALLVKASNRSLARPEMCQICEFKENCSTCSPNLRLYQKSHRVLPAYVCKKHGL